MLSTGSCRPLSHTADPPMPSLRTLPSEPFPQPLLTSHMPEIILLLKSLRSPVFKSSISYDEDCENHIGCHEVPVHPLYSWQPRPQPGLVTKAVERAKGTTQGCGNQNGLSSSFKPRGSCLSLTGELVLPSPSRRQAD